MQKHEWLIPFDGAQTLFLVPFYLFGFDSCPGHWSSLVIDWLRGFLISTGCTKGVLIVTSSFSGRYFRDGKSGYRIASLQRLCPTTAEFFCIFTANWFRCHPISSTDISGWPIRSIVPDASPLPKSTARGCLAACRRQTYSASNFPQTPGSRRNRHCYPIPSFYTLPGFSSVPAK